ncbi:MAG: hypothetical protein QM733_08475 [Ilumatobacteraceae bacterium]
MSGLQTEFEFFLPKGFVDESGQLHRLGTMRLATARGRARSAARPVVRDADDPFLTILVLSRVVTRLGTITSVTPREIENLFAADLAYLQDVYGAINFGSQDEIDAVIDDAATRSAAVRRPAPQPVVDDDVAAPAAPRRGQVEEVGRRQP